MRAHFLGVTAMMGLAVASAVLLTGCGAGELGSELSMRPKPQSLDTNTTLHVPQDEPFSITLSSSQETPGLSGETETEKNVSNDGNASAAVKVRKGGSAEAAFQIGQSVINDSDQQVQLCVTARCSYETEVATVPPGPFGDAEVNLTLYARDGRNRLLKSLKFAAHASDEGAASSKNTKEVVFDLPLGARESVNLFVAGNVQIETVPEREASGRIELRGLEMVIETKPAPPVGAETAGNEQG